MQISQKLVTNYSQSQLITALLIKLKAASGSEQTTAGDW